MIPVCSSDPDLEVRVFWWELEGSLSTSLLLVFFFSFGLRVLGGGVLGVLGFGDGLGDGLRMNE